MARKIETYLGDGLYASFDEAGQFWLRAPRASGDHEVALEPHVLNNFKKFVKETYAKHGIDENGVPMKENGNAHKGL